MNNDLGYYQASINPTYISTWYTSFKSRAKVPKDEELFIINGQICTMPEGAPKHVKEPRPEQFADNKTHGRISPIALRKIKKAIDYTVYLAQPKSLPDTVHGKNLKFRLNFITLTLSSQQVHTDREIKKEIFQPMLNCFRQKYKVENYIWRGEKQANGNLHFHIVTDRFIRWNDLRNDWNKFQQNLGYITRYRQNQKDWHSTGFRVREEMLAHWDRAAQLKAYKDGVKCEWCNPNSTDVHSLVRVSNVKNYFVKYLTKDTQSLDKAPGEAKQFSNMDGRLWGCSSALSNIPGARADIDGQLTEELVKLKHDPAIRHFEGDFHTVTFIDIDKLIATGFTVIPSLFEEFIKQKFPSYRPPTLFDQN
jgi:hypothetical protein